MLTKCTHVKLCPMCQTYVQKGENVLIIRNGMLTRTIHEKCVAKYEERQLKKIKRSPRGHLSI